MEFEEFEATQGKGKPEKSSCNSSKRYVPQREFETGTGNGIIDQMSEWETWTEYMDYGMGCTAARDAHGGGGLYLPHRKKNDL